MSSLSQLQYESEFSYLQGRSYSETFIDNRKIYRCTVSLCEKTFKFKSEMNRHLASHSSLRPYPCLYPNCGKTFKRRDALTNHSRLHNDATPFTCVEENCGCKFPTKSALSYHLLKHNGERVFECEQPGCDRTFMTLAQLKQHMKASTYHKKIQGLVSSSEGSSTSYYSPQSGPSNESGKITEISYMQREEPNLFDKVEKKLHNFDQDYYAKTEKLQDGNPYSFTYLQNIYGNISQEAIPRVQTSEEISVKIPELNINLKPYEKEVNTEIYTALKSILEDGASVEPKKLINDNNLYNPFQNTVSTLNPPNKTLVPTNIGNFEVLEAKREPSLDFESWLQGRGFQDLYT